MTTETIITRLARGCVEALSYTGYKGKRRDEATVAFWNGAIIALHGVKHEDADWVSRVGHMLIATRGYKEIEEIIRKADAAKASSDKPEPVEA
jgi:hypothetical protein